MADTENELAAFYEYSARIAWVNANFITYDTDWLNSKVSSEVTLLSVRLALKARNSKASTWHRTSAQDEQAARRHRHAPPSGGRRRNCRRTRDNHDAPAVRYGAGKFTIDGKELNLEQLSEIIGQSRDPKKLQGRVGRLAHRLTGDEERLRPHGRDRQQGRRRTGLQEIADMWLSTYDMPPEHGEELEKLWNQVRAALQGTALLSNPPNQKYGNAIQPKTGPIRADLLGNMWAQDWSTIYPLVAPEIRPGYDFTTILKAKKFDEVKMVKTGEGFYTSLGLDPLPETFWDARSSSGRAIAKSSAMLRRGIWAI